MLGAGELEPRYRADDAWRSLIAEKRLFSVTGEHPPLPPGHHIAGGKR